MLLFIWLFHCNTLFFSCITPGSFNIYSYFLLISFSVVPCPALSNPVNGSMNCHHLLGSFSYRSTCGFTCDEGYELVPSNSTSLQCGASGRWNNSQPQCSGMSLEHNLHVPGTNSDWLEKQMYTYAETISQILTKCLWHFRAGIAKGTEELAKLGQ